jgi:6,7-dimethyl-8-ribityllumazine synthase
LREVMRDTSVPVAFGVLTTNDSAQALARCGGDHGNKGEDCALVAIEMVRLMGRIEDPPENRR